LARVARGADAGLAQERRHGFCLVGRDAHAFGGEDALGFDAEQFDAGEEALGHLEAAYAGVAWCGAASADKDDDPVGLGWSRPDTAFLARLDHVLEGIGGKLGARRPQHRERQQRQPAIAQRKDGAGEQERKADGEDEFGANLGGEVHAVRAGEASPRARRGERQKPAEHQRVQRFVDRPCADGESCFAQGLRQLVPTLDEVGVDGAGAVLGRALGALRAEGGRSGGVEGGDLGPTSS